MDPEYENKRRGLEKNYWLFRARRELVVELIHQNGLETSSRILDIGCGGGYLAALLEDVGSNAVFGLDISERAVAFCRQRGMRNIFRGDGARLALADGVLDAVVAVDVLEHLTADAAALREWSRLLKEEGKLIITVPAFKFLWSGHDEVCHHFRRYSKAVLVNLLQEAGFVPQRVSFWNFSLFFPLCLIRIFRKLFPGGHSGPDDRLYILPTPVNNILLGLLRLENRFLNWMDFPVGISLFVVARKSAKNVPQQN